MKDTDQELLKGIEAQDPKAVARLITLAENRVPRARKIQAKLFPQTGRAHVIGITGSPGAGKSTLVDQLVMVWREQGLKVAVLAIDPSSPFSGGAVLGDRIRMTKAADREGVFIRSMASRGSLGGVSKATLDAVQILDAAGYDLVVIETVGVGQGEVDIVRIADTCLVVLVPGMGDSVQSLKAGIMEIADLFVINKADRDGADILEKDIRLLLSLAKGRTEEWSPPILKSVATEGKGASEIVGKVKEHQRWLRSSDEGVKRRKQLIRDRIVKLAADSVLEKVLTKSDKKLEKLVEKCFERTMDPFAASEKLIS